MSLSNLDFLSSVALAYQLYPEDRRWVPANSSQLESYTLSQAREAVERQLQVRRRRGVKRESKRERGSELKNEGLRTEVKGVHLADFQRLPGWRCVCFSSVSSRVLSKASRERPFVFFPPLLIFPLRLRFWYKSFEGDREDGQRTTHDLGLLFRHGSFPSGCPYSWLIPVLCTKYT